MFYGFQLLDVFGPLDMFGNLEGKVRVVILGERAGMVASSAGPAVAVDHALDAAPHIDILMVPGGMGTRREVGNTAFIASITRLARSAPHVASICTGGDYYDKYIAPLQRKQGRPEPGGVGDISTSDVKQGGLGPESPSVSPKTTLLPSQPGHADHALYQQIRGGVMQLDAQHGKEWDGASQRMTASLLALAKEEGLSRVDHVALNNPTPQLAGGEKVFVVQGRSMTRHTSGHICQR